MTHGGRRREGAEKDGRRKTGDGVQPRGREAEKADREDAEEDAEQGEEGG